MGFQNLLSRLYNYSVYYISTTDTPTVESPLLTEGGVVRAGSWTLGLVLGLSPHTVSL